MQMVQKVGGLLGKRKEGQGPLGKTALPSSSLRWEIGEGCSRCRRPWAGGLGPAALELGGGLRKGEKEEGALRGRFPVAAWPGVA